MPGEAPDRDWHRLHEVQRVIAQSGRYPKDQTIGYMELSRRPVMERGVGEVQTEGGTGAAVRLGLVAS